MCGITGFWQTRDFDLDPELTLSRMMALLHHRGPDGNGHHIDTDRGLAMGHTRLSIIDLKTGDQPIRADNGKLVLTANGEFYDYKQARATFVCGGHRFQTKSDSEVALSQYRERGLDFVHELRGEFAFALYDYREDALILVRDRFGIKPLYFHKTDHAIFWGSEVKSLLANRRVPKEIDPRSALNQMMQVMVPGTTSFRDIHALQPGHMLIVKRNGDKLETKQIRYWDMIFPEAKEHDKNPNADEYVAGVQERLIDAVRARLEADVPVGCYLSGGIDSCSILGMATAMQQSPVKAFTISFDEDAYDESTIATEMAMSTRADQEILKLTAAELYGDDYVRTVWHAERTFYNTLGVAKWHMSKRVRECGMKVVVTGEGSDELFGGYAFFKRDFLLHGAEHDPEMVQKLREQMDASNAVIKGAILSEQQVSHPAFDELVGFTPSWIQPWIITLGRVRGLLSQRFTEATAQYDPVAAVAEQIPSEPLKGRHPLDKAQYTWIKTMLEGQILTWGGDRVDMANSMESRPAFLDHNVAHYAARIPPKLRIRDGIEKWVLREAMRGVLPEVLYKREKFAFMAPPGHKDTKKQDAIRHMVDTRLSPERIDDAGIFSRNAVSKFLDEYWANTDPVEAKRYDIILNHLLGLQILHQELVEKSKSV